MSFISTLTWSSLEIQSIIENPDVGEAEKDGVILKHLSSLAECDREVFPEFELGWEWFNVKQNLTVGDDFKGQIVVVDFFTYCCINCMHILPDLHALEEKYPSEKTGVIVVGVHSAKFENEKVSGNIMAAIQRYDIHHPVVNDSEAVLWKKLEITCWPTLLILGPDSKPLFVIIGEGHRDVLFRYVQNALLFYKDVIVPRPLPLLLNSFEIFQSHLLFPGKVCIFQCECIEVFANSKSSKEETTFLAVADTGHHRILILSLEGEIKDTIGGPMSGWKEGTFKSAKFQSPQGMAFLPPCYLYVADTGNHCVRMVDFSTKEVRTVCGTNIQSTDKEGGKPGVEQPLASPWDLCLANSPTSSDPDILVIANAGTHQIWGLALRNLTWWKKLQVEAGTCFRLAGSGAEENRNNSYPAKAAFAQPSGLCSATLHSRSGENLLFVADSESSSIRQVNLIDGSVKALVGGDKDPMNLFCFGDKDNDNDPKGAVLLQHPLGVAWNSTKLLLYVADSYNHKIKTVDPLTKVCSTFMGNGKAGWADGILNENEIQFNEPGGICVDAEGSAVYVADTNNHCIRKINVSNLALQFVQTIKVHTKQVEQKSSIQPDFEVSSSLPSNMSNVEWTLTFHCSDQWKWSEDAPHTWSIKRLENLEATEETGRIIKGEMRIALILPQTSETNNGDQTSSLLVQTQLFLCASASGVCTKKSITILLKISVEEKSHNIEGCKLHHDVNI